MPRRDQIKAHEERDFLAKTLSGPRFALVTTEFAIHERNDVQVSEDRWEAHPREIAREDDLAFIVDLWRQKRVNGWEIMTPSGRERFDELVAAARAWGTAGADVVHVPIVFTCTEDSIEQIRDDRTETKYFSGGWRSSKTYRLDQWLLRGWARFGAQGRLFWLVGPERKHAFRMMQKLFLGRKGTPSIAPSYKDEAGQPRSMLAPVLPASFSVPDASFPMIDGARVELYHTKTVSALEGEDVQRIAMDEAVRMKSADAYKICRGRVTQCGGQVGLASVPDDDGAWVFDEIVAPVEAGTAPHKVVHFVSTYDNVWLPEANAKRLEEGETDPVVRDQKIHGKWTRAGLYAYSDVFHASEIVLEELAHDHDAWGFEHDVTGQWTREAFGRSVGYTGAADFNFRPQTDLLARIFARDRKDWRTWHLVFLFEQVLQRADARQAAAALRDRDGGVYQGAALVGDCNAFWDGHRYGGVASKTSDAFEFTSRGFLMVSPIVTPPKKTAHGFGGGAEGRNPEISASRRLVRQLLHERRILVSAGGCPLLARALPRVPHGGKPKSAANTSLDQQIYNLDDCVRYLAWKVFGDRMVPQKPTTPFRVRGAPMLGGARRA